MQQYSLVDVLSAIHERLANGQEQFVPPILNPALDQFPDHPAIWYYAGNYYQRIGQNAMACACWERSYQLEPQAVVLSCLGAVLKETGRPDQARTILKHGLDMIPDDEVLYTNLVGAYVNEGNPLEGIEYGERSLALGHQNRHTQFNLALLHLEAGHFARGFELYATGTHRWRDLRKYEGAQELTPLNFQEAKGTRLIVYGEQGIGDEIMYATMLREAVKDFQVIFDCHPRLRSLHASSPWTDDLLDWHDTRKREPGWYKPGMAEYYAPIGNLGQFYRRTPESFAWTGPYYTVDPHEVNYNRYCLAQLAEGRKIIGLAFRGGSLKTARNYRVVPPPELRPLLERDDLMFVALDYEDISNSQEWIVENFGPNKLVWYPSITWTWDYEHQGALMAACDAVVTVCQSTAHLAAAMGLHTRVLTPSRPAWRYGVREGSGDPWYWYPSGQAFLHRQQGEGKGSWKQPVAEISEVL